MTAAGHGAHDTHLAVEFFHRHEVEGFERVSCGSDEVQASMDAGVMVAVQGALDLQLLLEIRLKLGVDELHNGLVAE